VVGLVPQAMVLPLAPRTGRAAPRVIVQARKLGRSPFRLLAPFVIHAGPAHDGDRESYTPEAEAVLRGGGGLAGLFR
jgi:tRNA1Val (adenine37-N6)-methyltransferase